MTYPRLSVPSAPFLPWETLRELSEAARAAGTGQVPDERWTARLFLDGTPAAVAVLDADLRYLYLNDTLARFNGLPVEEHLGRPYRPRARPGPRRHVCAGPPGPRRRTRRPGHRRPCPAPAGEAGQRPRTRGPPRRPSLGAGFGGYESRHRPLPPGTLLLAYTDGLVERRGEDIDTGLAALAHAPVAAGNALPDILNTVLDRLAPANSEDDVTLLAARTR